MKVTGLGRLSPPDWRLVALGAELRKRDVGLHVVEQGIDTDTVEGRAQSVSL